LRAALESAVGQTYPNLDVIVTDNESTPDAFAEVKAIVEDVGDSRIRIIRHEENQGMLRNNVEAMRHAPGTYVANLHDDDVWEPTFVETLVAGLEANPETTMAFADHYLIDDAGTILPAETQQNTKTWNREGMTTGVYRPFYALALVERSVPAVMGSIFRREAIPWDDFHDEAKLAYDLWLAYLASRDGQGAYYVDERLTQYRTHQQSVTAQQSYTLSTDLLYCYRHFLQDERLASIRPGLSRWFTHYQVNVALHLLDTGRRKEARAGFWEAGRAAWSGRAAAGLALSYMPGNYLRRPLQRAKQLLSPKKQHV